MPQAIGNESTGVVTGPNGVSDLSAHTTAAPEPDRMASLRTRTVLAGDDVSSPMRPLSDPIAATTVYAYRDPATADFRSAADPPEANYVRDGMPNACSLERAIADLEGAEDAHAAASGMAAIALIFLAHLRSGDRVVAFTDGYCESRTFLSEELPRFGVQTTFVDAEDPPALAAALQRETRLVFVETIANPTLRIADLDAIAALTRARGVLLCVDNTFATPMLCRPLEHGADLVLHSATKFIGGHHDLVAGVVAGQRDLIDPIRRSGRLYGMTLGAMDAWLALRGVRTLAPRVAWMCESAGAIARFLQAHPAVASVSYPGLPDGPQAGLSRRLLPNGAGAMLTFALRGGHPAAMALIRGLTTIPYALSLGGTSTTVCFPPQAEPASCALPDAASMDTGKVRMSVGLEAAADLIADLDRALAALPGAM